MKKNAKLALSRETLRMLALDGPSLQRAAGAALTYPQTRCRVSECGTCPNEPSGNPGCHND